jgi:hypothetical protein
MLDGQECMSLSEGPALVYVMAVPVTLIATRLQAHKGSVIVHVELIICQNRAGDHWLKDPIFIFW